MVYVNTERDELIHFNSVGEPTGLKKFKVNIPIETQLRAVGQEFKMPPTLANEVPKEQQEFVHWLVDNYDGAYRDCLKRVVSDLAAARRGDGSEITLAIEPRGRGLTALQRLHGLGVIDWDPANRSVRVLDSNAWGFLNGGWVEIYALTKLHHSDLFDEVLGNVQIKGFEGEMDVVVSRNGRLAIIECKTKGPHGEGAATMAAKLRQHEIIFGGSYAQSMFALASDAYIKDIRGFSTQYGIRDPICGSDLRNLARIVKASLTPA